MMAEESESKRSQQLKALPTFFLCENELLYSEHLLQLHENEEGLKQHILSQVVFGSLEVSLKDIMKSFQSGQIDEAMLDKHLRFYLRKRNRQSYQQHLLFLARISLQSARSALTTQEQIPFLFKAIDFLRMYIHSTERVIDLRASSMIVHIFSVLPDSFDAKFLLEQKVYRLYAELYRMQRKAKKQGIAYRDSPLLRTRIAKLYVEQKNYYDGLTQFDVLANNLEIQNRQMPNTKIRLAQAHAWIANILQEMIHYAQPGQATILVNFIYRYNRDYASKSIPYPVPILQRNDAISRRQVKKKFIEFANKRHQVVEAIAQEVYQSGYSINMLVIDELILAKLPNPIIRALKASQNIKFVTVDTLFKHLEKSCNVSDSLRDKIWRALLSQEDNLKYSRISRLKRNPKWIDVYFHVLFQTAKNHEYLQHGDHVLDYAQKAFELIEPFSTISYLQDKIEVLRFMHRIAYSPKIPFRQWNKKKRKALIQEIQTKQGNFELELEQKKQMQNRLF